MKRKQIKLKMYQMDNLHIENGKFIITEPGSKIAHFRNYFIAAIEKVLQSEIQEDTYFILKFNEIEYFGCLEPSFR